MQDFPCAALRVLARRRRLTVYETEYNEVSCREGWREIRHHNTCDVGTTVDNCPFDRRESFMEQDMMAASNTWMRSQVSESGIKSGKRKVRRVLIVDDHPIVRQGLRRVMENEEDLTVCGEAETARDARAAIKELNPDVMIADISLKQGDGIELVRDVRAHHPQLPILVLSMHDETIY